MRVSGVETILFGSALIREYTEIIKNRQLGVNLMWRGLAEPQKHCSRFLVIICYQMALKTAIPTKKFILGIKPRRSIFFQIKLLNFIALAATS